MEQEIKNMYNSYDFFEKTTGYDLRNYLIQYEDFIKNHKGNILNFYNGQQLTPNSDSFRLLNELSEEIQKVLNLFISHKNSFQYVSDWELLEVCESIQQSFLNIFNSFKYFKTSRTKNSYLKSPNVEVVTIKNQTIEDLARNIYGDNDSENKWIEIATLNNLKEEDLSINGGQELLVNLDSFTKNDVEVIYDDQSGEKIYGLDLSKTISFDLLNQDLLVLSYEDTARQSFSILANLNRGDLPEFPNIGKDVLRILGSSMNTVLLPSLIRQIQNVYATDDSFTDFFVLSINKNQDMIFVEFEAKTKYKLILNENISLNL